MENFDHQLIALLGAQVNVLNTNPLDIAELVQAVKKSVLEKAAPEALCDRDIQRIVTKLELNPEIPERIASIFRNNERAITAKKQLVQERARRLPFADPLSARRGELHQLFAALEEKHSKQPSLRCWHSMIQQLESDFMPLAKALTWLANKACECAGAEGIMLQDEGPRLQKNLEQLLLSLESDLTHQANFQEHHPQERALVIQGMDYLRTVLGYIQELNEAIPFKVPASQYKRIEG